jgi:hypothetical protein
MAKSLFKMKGGFRAIGTAIGGAVCPPGVFCIDNSTMLFGICVLVIILGFFAYIWKRSDNVENIVAKDPPTERVDTEVTRIAPVSLSFGGQRNSDPRFSPLPPEQSYYAPPTGPISQPIPAGVGAIIPVGGATQVLSPINVMSQGYPDAYQQIGVLTAPGGTSMSASPDRTILPLFGRRTNYGRDRWNYYTRTDGMNPVQVPLQFKRQNCDDDNGCQEIITGDSVGVPILGQSYTANVFRYATPRYLPVV